MHTRGLGGIYLVGESLQHRERFRGVEIIVHGLLEALAIFAWGRREQRQVAQRSVQAAEGGIGLLELVEGVVDRTAVMTREQEVAQYLGVAQPRQHLAQGEEVAERLRHLLLVDVDEAVVHPDIGELVAARAAGLCDLVLVMRKLQIETAAVQVEMRAEERRRHRGALDVPAGAARSPR